jgi:hypothetical protein
MLTMSFGCQSWDSRILVAAVDSEGASEESRLSVDPDSRILVAAVNLKASLIKKPKDAPRRQRSPHAKSSLPICR